MSIVHSNIGTTRAGGVTGAGFKPGQSGNPGGRPKGLTRRVRELVGDDGEVIAEYMLSVMTDEMQRTVDRMEAAKWLSDRGFGKAVQAVDLDVEHHTSFDLTRWLDLTKLSVADLDTVIEILEKAESDEASELLVEREPPGQLTPVPPRGH